jgi:hypothetical protein
MKRILRNKTVLATAVGLSLAGVLAGCASTTSAGSAGSAESASGTASSDSAGSSSGSASGSSSTPTSTSTSSGSNATSTSDDTTAYKDGTYSADGTYSSPGGSEEIAVTVTVKSDLITAVTVKTVKADSEAAQYQQRFESGISSAAVGKSLATLSVGAVAGSSLTGQGFNAALATIRTEAKT